MAARNARRLLNLVDTLLDFSRLEAGLLPARLEPGEAPEAGIPDAIAGENPGADPPAGGSPP
jgi:signal transduction histidine kinase